MPLVSVIPKRPHSNSRVPGNGRASIPGERSTLTVTADQDALGLHEQRELDIGPLQMARTALTVPMPAATPYGRWPMRVRMTDGAFITREFVLTLEHDPPFVSIALIPDAASYQASAPVTVRVDLSPGMFARPFPA